MEEIQEETIDLILSEKFDLNFWYFELGRADQLAEEMSVDNQFMNSFWDRGERLWEKYKEKLRKLICNSDTKRIGNRFEELVLGNGREIAVVLLMELTNSDHGIGKAIAIPLVAILLKKQLNEFCSELD